ncbi:MAG: hypothetical protein Kow0029_09300 [Candidatus Rifleibacteriota bacterium]
MNISQPHKKIALENDSLLKLTLEAAIGGFWKVIDILEFLLVWYIGYPVLFFANFFMLHIFWKYPLEDANVIFWLNLMITMGTLFYFGSRLLTQFISMDHSSYEYYKMKPSVRFDVLLFIAANAISYYTMKVPVMRILEQDNGVTLIFKVFLVMYAIGVFAAKKYYDKYMR